MAYRTILRIRRLVSRNLYWLLLKPKPTSPKCSMKLILMTSGDNQQKRSFSFTELSDIKTYLEIGIKPNIVSNSLELPTKRMARWIDMFFGRDRHTTAPMTIARISPQRKIRTLLDAFPT